MPDEGLGLVMRLDFLRFFELKISKINNHPTTRAQSVRAMAMYISKKDLKVSQF